MRRTESKVDLNEGIQMVNANRAKRIERFSYDLEMKTYEQNRNNKRTEIERFDWVIERIQTRVAYD